jgi:tetratricopeptide (TPR) repeat protein
LGTRPHDPGLGLQIANDLSWVWVVLGDGVAVHRVRAALAAAVAAGVASPYPRVLALLGLAWLEASAGDVAQGHAAVSEAISLLESDGDAYLDAKSKWYLAYVLSQQGRFPESLALLEESRPMFRELGYEWEQAASWVLTAHCAVAAGDPASAEAACREAERDLGRLPDPWLLVHTEAMLGAVAQTAHQFADACEHLGRAARDAGELGFAATEAYHLANLGRAQQQRGDIEAAADTLHRAVETARATADLRVAALARTRLSRVLREQGHLDAARTTLQLARDWYQASGGGDGSRLADYVAASMTSQFAAVDIERLEALLADAHEAGDIEIELLALDVLARVRADAGDLSAAGILLDKADSIMPAARHHVVESDRVDAVHARRIVG